MARERVYKATVSRMNKMQVKAVAIVRRQKSAVQVLTSLLINGGNLSRTEMGINWDNSPHFLGVILLGHTDYVVSDLTG